MAETADAIILAALRLLKVKQSGEALTASESADGLIAINDIFSEWNTEPKMHTAKEEITQTLTATDATYTFGTGGDNSTRPIEIYSAFIRDSNNIDFPVSIISNEDYSLKRFKTTASNYPYNLYYRPEYPLGIVTLYPVPSSAYTLYLEVQPSFAEVATGATSIDLAPGYIKALKFNLAVAISDEYKDASMNVQSTAISTIAGIKRRNSKDKPGMVNTDRLSVGRNLMNGFFLSRVMM